MDTRRTTLTEEDKMNIWALYKQLGSRWVAIGNQLNINPNTARTFVNRYKRTYVLAPKRGAPFKISPETEQLVIDLAEAEPDTTLQNLSLSANISPSSCKKILNKHGIQYFPQIPICRMTTDHRNKRFAFANYFANLPLGYMHPIVFSDESTVCVNLSMPGIWRRRGLYPPETFYTKDQKPKSVMIWGAIGPRGWKSKLIRVEGHVNSEKYIHILDISGTIEYIRDEWNGRCIFQQDNAPSHTSAYSQEHLAQRFSFILEWPPKSPDLSPIEQIWAFIKKRLRGRSFESENDLFAAIETEWNEMPSELFENYYNSFQARCVICAQSGGEHLNGKWNQVKKVHNSYRENQQLFL